MKTLSVPVSKSAMLRLNHGQCQPDDLIEIVLAQDEYHLLWQSGILDKLNSKLDLLIDDFEDEEIIGSAALLSAREEVITLLEKQALPVLKSLLSQIDNAINYNTGLFFYF